jgi:mannose-6-phosphate isomerase-like protein (cupin superfamily)
MGHSHAIYNPGKTPVEFININVSAFKGQYDAFNLDDARIGVPKDAKPVFMTMRLDKTLLRPMEKYHGGDGTAMYRRALDPTVFLTNWSYVDHLALPAGASEGLHRHAGVEEVYYVMTAMVKSRWEPRPRRFTRAMPCRFSSAKRMRSRTPAPATWSS